MTHAEVLLWGYIRRKQIMYVRFRRQFSIEQFIVDFYAPQVKLAIEIDGMTHLTDEEIDYDNWRQNILVEKGIKILRFTNTDVYDNIEGVVKAIHSETEIFLKLLKK